MTRMSRMIRFVITVILTAALATAMSTQFVLNGLISVGAEVSMADRLSMTGFDIVGMGPLYAVFILLGLGIAFFAADRTARLIKLERKVIYTVAGMVAMLLMLVLMEQVFFGVPLIPGARSLGGLLAQVLIGGLAGFTYASMSKPVAP